MRGLTHFLLDAGYEWGYEQVAEASHGQGSDLEKRLLSLLPSALR